MNHKCWYQLHIHKKDYYHGNPYATYNYGDRPVIKIENELITQNLKLLIVKDSFANCVIPFLSMGIKNIDDLDTLIANLNKIKYVMQVERDNN